MLYRSTGFLWLKNHGDRFFNPDADTNRDLRRSAAGNFVIDAVGLHPRQECGLHQHISRESVGSCSFTKDSGDLV